MGQSCRAPGDWGLCARPYRALDRFNRNSRRHGPLQLGLRTVPGTLGGFVISEPEAGISSMVVLCVTVETEGFVFKPITIICCCHQQRCRALPHRGDIS